MRERIRAIFEDHPQLFYSAYLIISVTFLFAAIEIIFHLGMVFPDLNNILGFLRSRT